MGVVTWPGVMSVTLRKQYWSPFSCLIVDKASLSQKTAVGAGAGAGVGEGSVGVSRYSLSDPSLGYKRYAMLVG